MKSSIISAAVKYYHTVKHLKFIQMVGQLSFRFRKIKPNLALPPTRRNPSSQWAAAILKSPQPSIPNKLVFLNQEKAVSDHSIWGDANIDKLWLYHLHYHDVIHSCDGINEALSNAFIHRWIKENPPAVGCGWEPYPISLRIVNWIKWILQGHEASAEMLHSLAIQSRYLCKRLEIHLLGNHILANAKALLFSGVFFEGKEAQYWFKKGLKLFNKELAEQILPDGGHFELSPMYHCIILEDILDVINLFKTYRKPVPTEWIMNCEKMFSWLHHMCHLDGDISFFNDAALGMAPTLEAIKQYQERLSLNQKLPKQQSLMHLVDSGYCRIQRENILLLTDIGNIGASYQPGHGHADTLSFELSLAKQRIIVNSGTSCYAENAERLRQRGSKAHNTLVVDDHNSSAIWKSFRVAKRAKIHDLIINESKEKTVISACHDGYYSIGKIVHTRTWTVMNHAITIEDEVSGHGFHKIGLFFHLHPEIKMTQESDTIIKLYDLSHHYLATFELNHPMRIVDSTYHPRFNVSIPNKMILAEIYQHMPVHLQTSIKFNW